jgi:K(+)-stimulated pyrophosphate-energized sodium pump
VILGALIAKTPGLASSLGLSIASNLAVFPIALGAGGIIGSIIGGFYIRRNIKSKPMGALNIALILSAAIAVVIDYFFANFLFGGSKLALPLFGSAIIGVIVVYLIEQVADYYTSYNYPPVKFVAESSQTSAATNFLAGFSVGLRSTFPSAIVLVAAIIVSYSLGLVASGGNSLVGVYSTAVTTMAMLSLTGIIMSIDSFGPITDNANGIVEMAALESGVREVTDELDAVGNTTKATTKGFAIMSAALAAISLFQAFQTEVSQIIQNNPSLMAKYGLSPGQSLSFTLTDPGVIVGLFIGSLLPFFFSSFLIQAVGRAAFKMVNEVRRQFREIPGILEGNAKPDYAVAVSISTTAALRELIAPGLLAVLSPIVVGFVLGPRALGGLLIGSVVSGVFLAFLMANGGAAWDNAKKYIELGNFGGKNTPVHAAAVMGDTVGDPFKDTAGPSINSLIKVLNTISIVFVATMVTYSLLL